MHKRAENTVSGEEQRIKLERPILSVDVVLLGIHRETLSVILYTRKKEPYRGARALPGAAVRVDETLEIAARRALKERIGFSKPEDGLYLEQLAAFDGLHRDPRGRTVSIAYTGFIQTDSSSQYAGFWKPVSNLREGDLPFDHHLILRTAITRVKGKLRYTNIAKAFLPEYFRIEALQQVYEAFLGRSLNRSNFRNKLLKIKLIEKTDVLQEAVGKKGGRPPHLYRFTQDSIYAQDRDFV